MYRMPLETALCEMPVPNVFHERPIGIKKKWAPP